MTDELKNKVAKAIWNAVWESDEAWELIGDDERASPRRWAQAAIDAMELTEEWHPGIIRKNDGIAVPCNGGPGAITIGRLVSPWIKVQRD